MTEMARRSSPAATLVFFVIAVKTAAAIGAMVVLSRDDFPPGFVFGVGSSAFQVEGATAEDGRKPSIWDGFVEKGYTMDKLNDTVTANQYHKYKEDIKLLHEMGVDAYRMSIAWSRLIPDGRGPVNPKGLEYYNNLIDELLSYGIQPHVTIYHFDFPQILQNEYVGLLSPKFIDDYTAYADVCFKEFGDRVKHWITVNEPNIEPIGGYDYGSLPLMRCSHPYGLINCTAGNSTTEPYVVAHHLLLAHASVVALYKEKYQPAQGGRIGITLLGWWFEPQTESQDDIEAASRMVDFHIGWFMHPLVYGDYPPVMRNNVGVRLPSLTSDESAKVKGSFDFIGFNHYLVIYVKSDLSKLNNAQRDYYADAAVDMNIPIPIANGIHVEYAPWALRKMLEHVKVNYGNPLVMIHENGYGSLSSGDGERAYKDCFRSKFLQGYLEALRLSMRNGSNVQGYFVWSFLDDFEFLYGYTTQFGLYGVDFSSKERTRYARNSSVWYKNFLRGSNSVKTPFEAVSAL